MFVKSFFIYWKESVVGGKKLEKSDIHWVDSPNEHNRQVKTGSGSSTPLWGNQGRTKLDHVLFLPRARQGAGREVEQLRSDSAPSGMPVF